MSVSGITTHTSAIVSQLEQSFTLPSVSALSEPIPVRLVGAAATLGVAGAEAALSAFQLLVLTLPVVVKETLELLRMQRVSELIPDIATEQFKALARKAGALTLHATVGAGLALMNPIWSVQWFDTLGLERVSLLETKGKILREYLKSMSVQMIRVPKRVVGYTWPLAKQYPYAAIVIGVFGGVATVKGTALMTQWLLHHAHRLLYTQKSQSVLPAIFQRVDVELIDASVGLIRGFLSLGTIIATASRALRSTQSKS